LNGSVDEDVGDDDDSPSRPPHMKDLNDVSNWLSAVEPDWDGIGNRSGPTDQTLEDRFDTKLPRLSDYEEFIKSSESYHWLVCKLSQYERLSFGGHNVMDEIGSKLRKRLRAQDSLRKMSIRRPLSNVHVDFVLQWHPLLLVKDNQGQDSLAKVLENTLCLTGSWCEAQAMTVTDYIRQTWPASGEGVICLFEKLLRLTEDQSCTSKTLLRYSITSSLTQSKQVTSPTMVGHY
jgi:hypothetical protein